MLDNELIDLVATRLEAASAAAGWNYIVEQGNEPSRQGINTAPTILFEKLFDKPYAWPMVKSVYQSVPNNFVDTETQLYETTFQVSSLVIQDPTDLSIPTASDVTNYLKQFMQSRQTISLWMAQGVGMLRVTDVRNPYFGDDRERFEAKPSFDFVVTHKRSIINSTPVVSAIDGAPSSIPGDTTKGVFLVRDDSDEVIYP